jgi:hypothetical protein
MLLARVGSERTTKGHEENTKKPDPASSCPFVLFVVHFFSQILKNSFRLPSPKRSALLYTSPSRKPRDAEMVRRLSATEEFSVEGGLYVFRPNLFQATGRLDRATSADSNGF